MEIVLNVLDKAAIFLGFMAMLFFCMLALYGFFCFMGWEKHQTSRKELKWYHWIFILILVVCIIYALRHYA